jgi:lactoylglutathione lyase
MKLKLNLVVIRAHDIERSASFYELIGLRFVRHRHGKGLEHYSNEENGVVFEIYPRQSEADSTVGVRLGFSVASVDAVVDNLASSGEVHSAPKDSPWGRRAVVQDPDGHRLS